MWLLGAAVPTVYTGSRMSSSSTQVASLTAEFCAVWEYPSSRLLLVEGLRFASEKVRNYYQSECMRSAGGFKIDTRTKGLCNAKHVT